MTVQETSLSQALAEVEFVVNQQGQTKGVFVPVAVWEALLAALEDLEDLAVARDFMRQRATARSPEEMGFEPWEEVAHEWDDDEATEAETSRLPSLSRPIGTGTRKRPSRQRSSADQARH